MPEATKDQITKKDLQNLEQKLLNKLVSKEEFEQKIGDLATKEELEQVREELLEKLATKEELKQEVAKLATREALEVVANQVARNTLDIIEIKNDVKEMRWEMSDMRHEFDHKFNVVLTGMDNVVKELQDMRTEQAAVNHALFRHDDRLEEHDGRIRKLELKRAS